jgi:hypothetical protein
VSEKRRTAIGKQMCFDWFTTTNQGLLQGGSPYGFIQETQEEGEIEFFLLARNNFLSLQFELPKVNECSK